MAPPGRFKGVARDTKRCTLPPAFEARGRDAQRGTPRRSKGAFLSISRADFYGDALLSSLTHP